MNMPRADAFVLFGATGDLAFRKILPALHALARDGRLHQPVIGVARSDWTLEQFRDRARGSIELHSVSGVSGSMPLLEHLHYVRGEYSDPATYAALDSALGSATAPLYYLAVPPSLFPQVISGLAQSRGSRDARVVVEKPFGRDLASADSLSRILHEVFDESRIFRIDHYLGKEAVQNLLVCRFANTFLEPIWNRNYVAAVEVTMAERFGIEGRGSLYEEVGAIRDVLQNHMLQVIGFLAMEPPSMVHRESIREEQAKIFRSMRPLGRQDIVRGQFRGYRDEPGVAPDSAVETFAAARILIDSWRWDGVPFLVRVGKRLPTTATEVIVWLKRPPLSDLCLGDANHVRFRLGPDVTIAIGAMVKRPGTRLVGVPTELEVVHHPDGDEMQAYERLLGDALAGDGTLFASQEGVEAAWAVVGSVLGSATPVHMYECGTWGPPEAERFAAEVGGWHSPRERTAASDHPG